MADDPKDPRRALAAGDLGSALALGAHGLPKDLVAAEHYLKIGAEGGDAGAMRNYALLLLQIDDRRAAEAAEWLRRAAELGDEEAADALKQLQKEADDKHSQALAKLRMMAERGDERARAMLVQLELEKQQEMGTVV